MTDIRDRIERRFEHLAAFLCRRRWWVVIAAFAVAAGLASGMAKLTIDTSNEGFLHPDDPILVQYDAFKDMFGREDMILVAIEPREIFTQETLRRIKALHEDLADNVPHLNDITSLANARNTYGDGDRLVVDDLMAQWPETPEDMAALKARVMANPLYRDRLISRDARLTTLVVELDAFSGAGAGIDVLSGFDEAASPAGKRPPLTDEENGQAVETVRTIIEKYDAEGFRLYMAGTPTVTEALKRAMQADMKLFMGLALLAIGLCLLAMFRRFAGVFLPLLVVVLSFVSTMGAMGYSGTPIKLPTIILPSFLLAVGVGNSVHVFAIFFQRRRVGDDKEQAISFALGHSGLAIVMTSLTTAGGLGSFSAAELAPIAQFGIWAPVGVMIALVLTVVLLPALIAVFPMGAAPAAQEPRSQATQRLLVRTGSFATDHAAAIVLASAGLLAFALLGALQLRFSHYPIEWFPEGHFFRVSTERIDHKLKGSMFLEILVDSGRENGLHEPALLDRMDEMRRHTTRLQMRDVYVGKTVSLVDVVKEIHQALNENRPDFHAVPRDRTLVAQELLLFENSGSDDLEDVVDPQFRVGRFTMKVPFVDAIQYAAFLEAIDRDFREILGDGVEIT
ncbi:MAG: MMPL family transporter, partial [Alphaproteobacteria bacterium]|nr:MMPL family transporter [Alphaproteobacteria bacterium]